MGLAVTDPLKIIAQPLVTVAASECLEFLTKYFLENEVERVVIGMPTQFDGSPSESQRYILPFMGRFRKAFPAMPISEVEEAGTSVEAFEAMLEGGVRKNARRQKSGIVDKTAACIILQRYMQGF